MQAECHQSTNIQDLQSCFTTINNWLTNNYLLLNPNKCNKYDLVVPTYELFTSELPYHHNITTNVPR